MTKSSWAYFLLGTIVWLSTTICYGETPNAQNPTDRRWTTCKHHDSLLQPCKPYDGYYGLQISLDTAISRIDNVQSRIDGIGVAGLFDHEFGLGLSAYRLASPLDRDVGGRQRHLQLSYYLFDYSWFGAWQDIFSSRWSVSLGQGSISVKDATNDVTSLDQRYRVWVGELRWGYYVTLTEFLRVGLDIGYRYVPVDGESMRGNNFSGMSYAIALRGGAL